MKDDVLEKANTIKLRISQLNDEINLLTRFFLPPTVEERKEKYGKNIYGWTARIFKANSIKKKQQWINLSGSNYKQCFQLTSEDVFTLCDLRFKEREKLKKEYEQLN